MNGVTPKAGERLREISRILVDARRRAGALTGFPGPLPRDLAEAYEVQAISRESWPDRVIGWKVGGIPPKHREALGASFQSGPIFARRRVDTAEGKESAMPVFAGGFAAIEPEFVLELGKTRAEDRLFIGAEIASSPIIAINAIGTLAAVCDFGNNHGVLVGPEILDWRAMKGRSIPVSAEIEGQIVGEKTVTDLPADVARACTFLFEHCDAQGIELPAGTLISTGAITGVHDASPGDRSTLRFGPLGTIDLRLCTMAPETMPERARNRARNRARSIKSAQNGGGFAAGPF